MTNLRDNVNDYLRQRDTLAAVCQYLARKLTEQHPEEASAASVLNGLIRNETVAGH